jgi:hypothetical protein
MKTFTQKVAILILLFLVCKYYSFSQTYNPFPQKYGKWIINREGPTGPDVSGPSMWNLTQYETNGDTVLRGFTYKKMMATNELKDIPMGPYMDIWAYNLGPKHLSFAYRNDIPTKKVYILTDANKVINGKLTTEYLWYDFNDIKVGDTLKITYADETEGTVDYDRISVKKMGMKSICSSDHKIFYFNCQLGGDSGRLIEGLGFADNFIKTFAVCPFEPNYIYSTHFSCSPTGTRDEQKNAPTVSAFPNPAFNTLQIKWSEPQQPQAIEWSIVDCLGKVILQKNNESEFIDVSALSRGLYFIILTDKRGNYYKNKFIKQE